MQLKQVSHTTFISLCLRDNPTILVHLLVDDFLDGNTVISGTEAPTVTVSKPAVHSNNPFVQSRMTGNSQVRHDVVKRYAATAIHFQSSNSSTANYPHQNIKAKTETRSWIWAASWARKKVGSGSVECPVVGVNLGKFYLFKSWSVTDLILVI